MAEWLRGSIRFDLNPAERGVWADLLGMAGESRTPGVIQATEGVAYPINWIAQALNIPPELLEQALKKLEETGRVNMDGGCINIINFEYYQTYDRTNPDKHIEEEHGKLVRR